MQSVNLLLHVNKKLFFYFSFIRSIKQSKHFIRSTRVYYEKKKQHSQNKLLKFNFSTLIKTI